MQVLEQKKRLWDNLKRMREERSMSVEQMARLTGIRPVGRYLAIEEGRTNLRLVTLVVLAEALELEPGELFRPTISKPRCD